MRKIPLALISLLAWGVSCSKSTVTGPLGPTDLPVGIHIINENDHFSATADLNDSAYYSTVTYLLFGSDSISIDLNARSWSRGEATLVLNGYAYRPFVQNIQDIHVTSDTTITLTWTAGRKAYYCFLIFWNVIGKFSVDVKSYPSPLPVRLSGKWKWIYSFGGEIPDQTPTTEFQRVYEFQPDSSFQAYRNDTLLFDGNYRIDENQWRLSIGDSLFSDHNYHVINYLYADSLYLTPDGFDVQTRVFVKIL